MVKSISKENVHLLILIVYKKLHRYLRNLFRSKFLLYVITVQHRKFFAVDLRELIVTQNKEIPNDLKDHSDPKKVTFLIFFPRDRLFYSFCNPSHQSESLQIKIRWVHYSK